MGPASENAGYGALTAANKSLYTSFNGSSVRERRLWAATITCDMVLYEASMGPASENAGYESSFLPQGYHQR